MSSRLIRLMVALTSVLLIGGAWASIEEDVFCPPLQRDFGPYDYLNRAHTDRHLRTVERRHFTGSVRNLQPRGETGSLIGDITYTLNWFPNHHAALDLFSRLAVREKSPTPLGTPVHIQCRFLWARQVNPHDEMVPVIHGMYFYRLERFEEARKMMEEAVEMKPSSATAHYNLGLVMVALEDFEAARRHAQRAYGLGFPLPGLREILARAGYPLPN